MTKDDDIGNYSNFMNYLIFYRIVMIFPVECYWDQERQLREFCLCGDSSMIQTPTNLQNQYCDFGDTIKLISKDTIILKVEFNEGVQKRPRVSHLLKEIDFESKVEYLIQVLEKI